MSFDYENENEFTLESILAEFKSDAFIAGQKKTPKSLMDDEVNKIVMEIKNETEGSADIFSDGEGTQYSSSPDIVADPDELFDEQVHALSDRNDPELYAEHVQSHQEHSRLHEEPTVERDEPAAENYVSEHSAVAENESVDGLFDEMFANSFDKGQKQSESVDAEQERELEEMLSQRGQSGRKEPRQYRESRRSYSNLKRGENEQETYPEVSSDDFNDVDEFDSYDETGYENEYAGEDYEHYSDGVNEAVDDEEEYERSGHDTAQKVLSIFSYLKDKAADIEEDEEVPEPDYRQVKKEYEASYSYYSVRALAGGIISVIMAVFTFIFEAGKNLPFGIGQNIELFSGILLIMQLVVMLLGVKIIASGVVSLFKFKADARSLIALSSFATVISALECMLGFEWNGALPYCAVSSFIIVFAMWGEKMYARAFAESLRTVVALSEPKGIASEYSESINKSVLKKYDGYTNGFYNNLIQADVSETAYKYCAPLIIVICAVLALALSAVNKSIILLPQFLSAVLCAGTGFTCIAAFSLPYAKLSRELRKSGTSIAGWGGVDDIYYTDGARMTDEDVFPAGTVKIEGMKVFKDVEPDKAIRYTSSLVSASQSGLSKVFEELARNQQLSLVRVDDFNCYEGGIGGVIRGDRVLTGSSAFMTLMGVHIPESMNIKNAVFTAVNNKLMCVFAVGYKPKASVRRAILDILHTGIKLFFAVRDFNITPLMLMQKFKIELDGIEYMPIEETYNISQKDPSGSERICAVIFRDGLSVFGEVITGGRRLRIISNICTAVSILTSLLGILIISFLCFKGAIASASAGNLLIFSLSMFIIVCLLSGFVKNKR